VLRDLTVVSWPPSYGVPEGLDLILRAPVAYYLPAATLGKWLGVHWADKLLLAWTGLGVLLFFQLLPLSRQPLRWALGLASVVLFSGLDIVGGLLFYGTWPPAGSTSSGGPAHSSIHPKPPSCSGFRTMLYQPGWP